MKTLNLSIIATLVAVCSVAPMFAAGTCQGRVCQPRPAVKKTARYVIPTDAERAAKSIAKGEMSSERLSQLNKEHSSLRYGNDKAIMAVVTPELTKREEAIRKAQQNAPAAGKPGVEDDFVPFCGPLTAKETSHDLLLESAGAKLAESQNQFTRQGRAAAQYNAELRTANASGNFVAGRPLTLAQAVHRELDRVQTTIDKANASWFSLKNFLIGTGVVGAGVFTYYSYKHGLSPTAAALGNGVKAVPGFAVGCIKAVPSKAGLLFTTLKDGVKAVPGLVVAGATAVRGKFGRGSSVVTDFSPNNDPYLFPGLVLAPVKAVAQTAAAVAVPVKDAAVEFAERMRNWQTLG